VSGLRCTGDCCREFYLPESPAVLAARALGLFVFGEGETDRQNAEELAKIAGMVRYVRHVVPGDPTPCGTLALYEEDVWTCEHFDGRDCTAYATRPNMCRNYPYGQPCNHAGCTWDAARAGFAGADAVGLAHPPTEMTERRRLPVLREGA
jgi:hypothetical protein